MKTVRLSRRFVWWSQWSLAWVATVGLVLLPVSCRDLVSPPGSSDSNSDTGAPQLQLSASQWVSKVGDTMQIRGALMDASGQPRGSEPLTVRNTRTAEETTVYTDTQGEFTYSTPLQTAGVGTLFVSGQDVHASVPFVASTEPVSWNIAPHYRILIDGNEVATISPITDGEDLAVVAEFPALLNPVVISGLAIPDQSGAVLRFFWRGFPSPGDALVHIDVPQHGIGWHVQIELLKQPIEYVKFVGQKAGKVFHGVPGRFLPSRFIADTQRIELVRIPGIVAEKLGALAAASAARGAATLGALLSSEMVILTGIVMLPLLTMSSLRRIDEVPSHVTEEVGFTSGEAGTTTWETIVDTYVSTVPEKPREAPVILRTAPVVAPIFLNGNSIGVGEWRGDRVVGQTYSYSFGSVSDYTTPAGGIFTLTDQGFAVTGVYERVPQPPVVLPPTAPDVYLTLQSPVTLAQGQGKWVEFTIENRGGTPQAYVVEFGGPIGWEGNVSPDRGTLSTFSTQTLKVYVGAPTNASVGNYSWTVLLRDPVTRNTIRSLSIAVTVVAAQPAVHILAFYTTAGRIWSDSVEKNTFHHWESFGMYIHTDNPGAVVTVRYTTYDPNGDIDARFSSEGEGSVLNRWPDLFFTSGILGDAKYPYGTYRVVAETSADRKEYFFTVE